MDTLLPYSPFRQPTQNRVTLQEFTVASRTLLREIKSYQGKLDDFFDMIDQQQLIMPMDCYEFGETLELLLSSVKQLVAVLDHSECLPLGAIATHYSLLNSLYNTKDCITNLQPLVLQYQLLCISPSKQSIKTLTKLTAMLEQLVENNFELFENGLQFVDRIQFQKELFKNLQAIEEFIF
jgi:hypothetical protein